jgi:hypothetical protein
VCVIFLRKMFVSTCCFHYSWLGWMRSLSRPTAPPPAHTILPFHLDDSLKEQVILSPQNKTKVRGIHLTQHNQSVMIFSRPISYNSSAAGPAWWWRQCAHVRRWSASMTLHRVTRLLFSRPCPVFKGNFWYLGSFLLKW